MPYFVFLSLNPEGICDLGISVGYFDALGYQSSWERTEYPCGHMKDAMSLEKRTFHCEVCGLVIDRDLNAARNLAEWSGVARTLETPVEGGVRSTVAEPLVDSASQ